MTVERNEIMAREFCLGSAARIPIGEGREFMVEGLQIAVFRSRNGSLYASQAICPHREGPLADGILGGSTLACPLHGIKFDLSTGRAIGEDCSLITYPVTLNKRGEIILSISSVSTD